MSDMKCPFCQQKLGIGSIDRKWLVCFNCHITGDDKLWQELINTRKALNESNEKLRHCVNMTVEELDELKGDLLIAQDALLHFSKDPIANNALKKITTQKQKEVK